MIAVCCAVADAAMARGKSGRGTMPGTIAWRVGASKARAVPVIKIRVRIEPRSSQPCKVPSANKAAQIALITWQVPAMARRSK